MKDIKKLFRSREHKVISGVMGGLAEHFNVSPVILRVILVIFVLGTGIFPGVIAYIIAVFVIPQTPNMPYHMPLTDDDSAV